MQLEIGFQKSNLDIVRVNAVPSWTPKKIPFIYSFFSLRTFFFPCLLEFSSQNWFRDPPLQVGRSYNILIPSSMSSLHVELLLLLVYFLDPSRCSLLSPIPSLDYSMSSQPQMLSLKLKESDSIGLAMYFVYSKYLAMSLDSSIVPIENYCSGAGRFWADRVRNCWLLSSEISSELAPYSLEYTFYNQKFAFLSIQRLQSMLRMNHNTRSLYNCTW